MENCLSNRCGASPFKSSLFRVVVRWQKSDGAVLRRKGVEMTIEDVRNNWDKISDFTEHSYPSSLADSNGRIYQVLQEIDDQPATRPKLSKNNTAAIDPVRLNAF